MGRPELDPRTGRPGSGGAGGARRGTSATVNHLMLLRKA